MARSSQGTAADLSTLVQVVIPRALTAFLVRHDVKIADWSLVLLFLPLLFLRILLQTCQMLKSATFQSHQTTITD